MSDDWRQRLIQDDAALRELLVATRTIAVVGMKASATDAAFLIPAYMQRHGYRVLPVNPRLADRPILGQTCRPDLGSLDPPIHLVNVFRASANIPTHAAEALALEPRPLAFWMQSGIRHPAAAEALARAGILVVEDRCLMVEHRRLLANDGADEPSAR